MNWVIIGAILAALWVVIVPLVLLGLLAERVLRELRARWLMITASLETRVLDIAAPRRLDLKYDDGRVTQQCCAECGGPVLDTSPECVEHRECCPGIERFLEIRQEFEKAKESIKQ